LYFGITNLLDRAHRRRQIPNRPSLCETPVLAPSPPSRTAAVAAPVPIPRVNLTRVHGVFAPHHRLRARITAGRGDRDGGGTGRGALRASALGCAQRLKRVFSIDIARSDSCAGAVRIWTSQDSVGTSASSSGSFGFLRTYAASMTMAARWIVEGINVVRYLGLCKLASSVGLRFSSQV